MEMANAKSICVSRLTATSLSAFRGMPINFTLIRQFSGLPFFHLIAEIAGSALLMLLITGKARHLVHDLSFLPLPPPSVLDERDESVDAQAGHLSHDAQTQGGNGDALTGTTPWVVSLIGALYVWLYLRNSRSTAVNHERRIAILTACAFAITAIYVWLVYPLCTCSVQGRLVTVGFSFRPGVYTKYGADLPSCDKLVDDYGGVTEQIWSKPSLLLSRFAIQVMFMASALLCAVSSVAVMHGLFHAATSRAQHPERLAEGHR